MKRDKNDQSNYLLALHSSSDTLGVAALDLSKTKLNQKSATFNLGRELSNKLFDCIDEVLPSKYWSKISRLGVATGPGGFTSTRLTVVMARTLAQQLDCSLEGISSFELMAPRLIKKLPTKEKYNPFWIIKDLKRRGIIGGKYKLQNNSADQSKLEFIELEMPHLLSKTDEQDIFIDAEENVSVDVSRLLELILDAHKLKKESLWNKVLPIYPTSPVSKS